MINGRGGTIDYKDVSWQGFEAQDLIATIDLGELIDINSVEIRFLQSQAFWIFLPKHVEIEHSIDGASYDIIYEKSSNNDFSFDHKFVSYKVDFLDIKSRYIRVKGYNLNECPDYHPGAGLPSWIFSDEIIIN